MLYSILYRMGVFVGFARGLGLYLYLFCGLLFPIWASCLAVCNITDGRIIDSKIIFGEGNQKWEKSEFSDGAKCRERLASG